MRRFIEPPSEWTIGSSAHHAAILFAVVLLVGMAVGRLASQQKETVVDIGSRLEPFVDETLIERFDGASLQLTPPTRREVVLTLDQPWEGRHSAYFTVFRDGDRVRLYYRGYCPDDMAEQQVTCLAESDDGVHFRRPELGLYDFQGTNKNNIVFRGLEAHNFAPFKDENPAANPDERYKAVGGVASKLYAFVSPDGIRWRKLRGEPILAEGAFDSLNVAFWDDHHKLYRCYSRFWSAGGYAGYRAIQSSTSSDFLRWSSPVPNEYPGNPPQEHFYTNATTPHPSAPHILLSFPMRFVPERTKLTGHPEPGVSDAVFMSSRDGVRWNRAFLEAWLRPGLDERNWTHRNIMPAWGIVETGDEFSLYVSEHYAWPDNRLRRVTVPRNRFASVAAGARGGSVTTKPLRFSGRRLHLNYSTSAAGAISCELLRPDGAPIPGFTSAEFQPLFGDELDAAVTWRGRDIADAQVNPLRIRFVLRDANVYSLQTRD